MTSKLHSTVEDVVALLEEKITYGEARQNEYDLYSEYQNYGTDVFHKELNKMTVRSLNRQVKKYWSI